MSAETLLRRFLEETAASEPAYQRIKEALAREIEEGELVPGDQVPSEHELVDRLGLSRMTVNRALRELSAEGLLVRSRGVGTFVADFRPRPAPLAGIENIADGIRQRGHSYRPTVDFIQTEPNVRIEWPEERKSFRDGAFHSRIVHREDGVPIQLEDRWVARSVVPDYGEQDFTRVTPSSYLSTVAPVAHGRHVVTAVLPDAEQARLLEIPRTEPCLLMKRWTWSAEGPVSLAHLLYPGSRAVLEGEFGE